MFQKNENVCVCGFCSVSLKIYPNHDSSKYLIMAMIDVLRKTGFIISISATAIIRCNNYESEYF